MNTGCLDKLKEMVESEFQANFEVQKELRKHARQKIFKIQDEDRKTYSLRKWEPKLYRVGDLVAIKRTQFGPHLNLKPKYLGTYSITRAKKKKKKEIPVTLSKRETTKDPTLQQHVPNTCSSST
ncbi:hypothetical protein HNY73_023086 [Argiope bruennichi]|uniref:Uncharacterized protein n=1 Tax=Argiope bruennichi TaxID=94029 RepID=A0A8T0E2Q9_ARGBR|nr:hypothetical protein HNY73_023086 [Argiope bruennichi]